jgi:hypothetical protein
MLVNIDKGDKIKLAKLILCGNEKYQTKPYESK